MSRTFPGRRGFKIWNELLLAESRQQVALPLQKMDITYSDLLLDGDTEINQLPLISIKDAITSTKTSPHDVDLDKPDLIGGIIRATDLIGDLLRAVETHVKGQPGDYPHLESSGVPNAHSPKLLTEITLANWRSIKAIQNETQVRSMAGFVLTAVMQWRDAVIASPDALYSKQDSLLHGSRLRPDAFLVDSQNRLRAHIDCKNPTAFDRHTLGGGDWIGIDHWADSKGTVFWRAPGDTGEAKLVDALAILSKVRSPSFVLNVLRAKECLIDLRDCIAT
jgi:hypothetical protein